MAPGLLYPSIRAHHWPQVRRRSFYSVYSPRLYLWNLCCGEYHGFANKSDGYCLLQTLHALWMYIASARYLPGRQWSFFVLVHVSTFLLLPVFDLSEQLDCGKTRY